MEAGLCGNRRRLIRDGVDTPLANLFVHAVKPSLPEAKGVERARSASEAFLFRRLETLPETKGRFQLNVRVPIAFDCQSQMEVDFLNEPLRIVLELDGSQHLSDPEAYRRDRRKDRLLQQNGYLILRFLAEDVGKDLDGVLDSILQSLAGRERSIPNIMRATKIMNRTCIDDDQGPFGLRPVISFQSRGRFEIFGPVALGRHDQPINARIFARTSANSSADTFPLRFAFLTRQSTLLI